MTNYNMLFVAQAQASENNPNEAKQTNQNNSTATTKSEVVKSQGFSANSSQSKNLDLASFVPMIAVFVIFYLLVIRPNVKKQKEQQLLIEQLKIGEKIITNSGLFGIITAINLKEEGIKEEFIEIEISKETKIKVLKNTVLHNLTKINKQHKSTKNK